MTAAAIRSIASAPRACELRRKLSARLLVAVALTALLFTRGLAAQAPETPAQPAAAEQHQPATAGHEQAAGEHGAAAEHAGAEAEHGGEHGGLAGLLWPVANFIVLVVLLNKFLRAPITEYLAARSSQIRKDLVEAAELNKAATAQLADVERKMQALPGELDALRTRGAEEIVAEEERIASAAAADRARLLTQTKREIEVRLQAAQRELSDHAAALALQLAEQKLATDMTAADHARLVDRYVAQVKER
jgi:F-type H+-transporting ATPase subunit b